MHISSPTPFSIQTPSILNLSVSENQDLLNKGNFRVLPRHSMIYHPGQKASSVYFLMQGTVKINTRDGDKDVIRCIVQPGELFGESTLTGETSRHEYAFAMNEEVHFVEIEAEHFISAMQSDFSLCQAILNFIGERLKNAENRCNALVFKDSRSRIIDFISSMATRYGRRVGFETLVKHHLTHQDIASLTGTSRQMVTMVLNDLKKANIIHFNRNRLLIRDLEKLAV